jgi:hypothetical protein
MNITSHSRCPNLLVNFGFIWIQKIVTDHIVYYSYCSSPCSHRLIPPSTQSVLGISHKSRQFKKVIKLNYCNFSSSKLLQRQPRFSRINVSQTSCIFLSSTGTSDILRDQHFSMFCVVAFRSLVRRVPPTSGWTWMARCTSSSKSLTGRLAESPAQQKCLPDIFDAVAKQRLKRICVRLPDHQRPGAFESDMTLLRVLM